MIHRHAALRIRPVRKKRNHPPICHPDRVKRAEGSSQVANFTLCWFIIPRGGFLRSADATVGMTKGGTCLVFAGNGSVLSRAERHTGRSLRFRWEVIPLRPLFLQCGTPYRPSSTACGRSPFPGGEGLGACLWAVAENPEPQKHGTKASLGGSWQGAALTDEGAGQREIF